MFEAIRVTSPNYTFFGFYATLHDCLKVVVVCNGCAEAHLHQNASHCIRLMHAHIAR